MVELEVNILRPFGPRILHGKIPQDYVDELNNECDSIIADEQKRKELDESSELVGHVSEELKCNMNNPKLKLFGSFLCELTKGLHNEYLKEKNIVEHMETCKVCSGLDETNDDVMTLNGGTTGISGTVELLGISDKMWQVQATVYSEGTAATPFA